MYGLMDCLMLKSPDKPRTTQNAIKYSSKIVCYFAWDNL